MKFWPGSVVRAAFLDPALPPRPRRGRARRFARAAASPRTRVAARRFFCPRAHDPNRLALVRPLGACIHRPTAVRPIRARARPGQASTSRRRSRSSRHPNRRIPSRSSARRPAASTPKAEGITPPRAASRAGTPRCSSRAGLLIGVAAAVAAARGDRNRMCLPAAAGQQHRGPFFVRPPPALPPRNPPRMWHRPPLLARRIRPATAPSGHPRPTRLPATGGFRPC